MKMLKDKRGITLIALVITVIVLLILAGITINLTIGEDGIITKAKEAGDKYAQAAENEQTDLSNFLQETEALINSNTGNWDNTGKVNAPDLLTGMTPIKFTTPNASTNGTVVTTTSSDTNWYNYEAKQWANAQTEDGSMWVWIPRFAYIVNSDTQTFDVVFLIGTTDNYYKEDGTIGTAQRATSENLHPDTTGSVYTVHPAFTNESSINYANGGWDSELTGIWVAKFEAGYPDSSTAKTTTIDTTNWYYPVFQGQKYSYSDITASEAFLLSQAIAKANNPYGLSSSNADSHLMKNSEWGAVAYLSQSQYGLNGTNIVINNVTYDGKKTTVRTGYNAYAVTGYAGTSADVEKNTLTAESVLGDTVTGDKISYAWYTTNGIKASSTGTIYGIYDLSGGVWERAASYVANNSENLLAYGNSIVTEKNRKYVMAYTSADSGITDYDKASKANYNANSVIGDAIKETSSEGAGNTSWYSDISYFASLESPFFSWGGALGYHLWAGLFSFYRGDGTWSLGFRPVLVSQ
jgi:hypothetical protein